jgi:nucleotide-binding universal stress UspA family protein
VIKRIVIPFDFSGVSARAADFGVSLAKQLEASVTFVSVLEVGDLRAAMKAGLHGFETSEDVRRQVEQWVEAQYKKIKVPTGLKTERIIRRGMPEREILQVITDQKADMVVMGSTGIARRIPIGSLTEAVMRQCDLPVVVIRDPKR